MDPIISLFILLLVSAFSVVLVYLVSRSTILKCKDRIARAVEYASHEASTQTDRHIIFEDYPVRGYLIGIVGMSTITCAFVVAFFFDSTVSDMGDTALVNSIIELLILGVALWLLYDLAQKAYNTSLVIVSEEGIDRRKFDDSTQRSVLFIRWNEVTRVNVGSSRQAADHVQVVIESRQGDVRLWAWWTNFEFLSEKILRLSPGAHISASANKVLAWKAEKVQSHPTTLPVSQATINDDVKPKSSLTRMLRKNAFIIGLIVVMAVLLLISY